MSDLPATTSEATPEFVTEALRTGGVITASTVTGVEHEQIGVGVGVLGQLARLTLTYDHREPDAPGSVVLKIPSAAPENRAVAAHYRFYEREGRFYEQLSDKVGMRVPRCYWSVTDPANERFGLMLEDFGGRTIEDQVAGVPVARARQAVERIAAMHASWWDSPALDALDWMPRLDDPLNLQAGETYREAWPLFVERIGDKLPDGAVELGERIQDRFEDLLRGYMQGPITVCHGDYRIDNILFDDAAPGLDQVGVIDWQISYRGAGATDIGYLLFQSLTTEDCAHAATDLLRDWYTALTAAGIDGYSWDDAVRDFRIDAAVCTVYPVTGVGQLDPGNERGWELLTLMGTRAFAAALALDAAELL